MRLEWDRLQKKNMWKKNYISLLLKKTQILCTSFKKSKELKPRHIFYYNKSLPGKRNSKFAVAFFCAPLDVIGVGEGLKGS